MADYSLLFGAAFFAGLIDAVVGGGGLIQIPALFSVMTQTIPATLLGTNKIAGVMGTITAMHSFARKVRIQWSTAVPATIAAFILSFLGAYTVTHVPTEMVRKSLPLVLILIFFYTLKKKQLGQVHAPRLTGNKETLFAVLVGGGVGFYDGLFGPGTGSFLVFLFVRIFGFDFLRASAVSKVVNVATNMAAIIWFGYSGHIIWVLALLMGVFNVAGSLVGTRLAMKYGSGFVRYLFIVVVGMLILKTSYDAFLK